MNKGLRILGFIVLGIILIPLIVIAAYVLLGASVFALLYFINRKKNGTVDLNEGKNYKIVSTLFFIGALLIAYFVGTLNIFTWQGYLWLQFVVFIGMLPMCYLQIIQLKRNKQ